jgi:hypothetical protein
MILDCSTAGKSNLRVTMKTAIEDSSKHQLPPTQHNADHNTTITALKTKVIFKIIVTKHSRMFPSY